MSSKEKRCANKNNAKSKKRLIKIGDFQNLVKIRESVAGIDIGSESHFVAAPDPKYQGKITVQQFSSLTSGLRECVEWLVSCNIKTVAMEATGVYWMVLFNMLEEAEIEVILVNARDVKKLKDKKTDVCDAEHLQRLLSYGMLEGAFIPEKDIGELRTILRLRYQHIIDSGRAIQRMQKALIRMNLRLDNVISDISGVTGMAIIHAILRGERDPKQLAEYRDSRCSKSEKEIEEALNGFYQQDQLFSLKQALDQHQFFLSQIAECDRQIQEKLSLFTTIKIPEIVTAPRRRKSKKMKPYEFTFDLKQELIRITGVDLTSLPGVGPSTALTMITETGLDMTRWKSPKHFASWLNLSPNNRVSGGKILNKRTRQGKNRAALTLRMAVSGLYRESNETALGAFFRKKRGQLGAPKAITAAANKLAKMYYNILLHKKEFIEPGADVYLEMQKEKYLRNVNRRISAWGYQIMRKPIVNKAA